MSVVIAYFCHGLMSLRSTCLQEMSGWLQSMWGQVEMSNFGSLTVPHWTSRAAGRDPSASRPPPLGLWAFSVVPDSQHSHCCNPISARKFKVCLHFLKNTHFIAGELSLWLLGLFCSRLLIRKSIALHARASICVTPLWSHREQSNATRYISSPRSGLSTTPQMYGWRCS